MYDKLISIFTLVDWPDYTSSESDTESEVEAIVSGKDNISPRIPSEGGADNSHNVRTGSD